MKKVLLSFFLLISTLMLSSCQVNWFGSHFDVPWYFIAVPVFVLFIVLYVIIVSKTYVCPKCKTEFKPKWYQIYITIHFNDSRIAKCPNCGRKGFCKRKDQWHLFWRRHFFAKRVHRATQRDDATDASCRPNYKKLLKNLPKYDILKLPNSQQNKGETI